MVVFALIALLVVAGCTTGTGTQTGTNVQVGKETVKIGISVPLSGDLAFLGEGIRTALNLALEDLGQTTYNYELVFEDDQMDPKKTATASRKLISVNNVDALISFSSGTGNVVTPVAQENKVIHFGIASDANIAKGGYNFIHWTPPPEEARVFVEELQLQGITKIAIIEMNHQGAKAIMDGVREQIIGTDIEIVAQEYFNAGQRDFKTSILKMKQASPELYIPMAFSPELEIIVRQIKEQGITEPMGGIENFELTDQLELFEGEWYVMAADASSEYNQAFRESHGSYPTIGSPNAYDILGLIVQGFEDASVSSSVRPSTAQAALAIKNIQGYDGVLGTLNVGSDGIVVSKAVVRKIIDGEPVTIRR